MSSTPKEQFKRVCFEFLDKIETNSSLLTKDEINAIRRRLFIILNQPDFPRLLYHSGIQLPQCNAFWKESTRKSKFFEIKRKMVIRSLIGKSLRLFKILTEQKDKLVLDLKDQDIFQIREKVAHCLITLDRETATKATEALNSFQEHVNLEDSQITELLDLVNKRDGKNRTQSNRLSSKSGRTKKARRKSQRIQALNWKIDKEEREASKSGRLPKAEREGLVGDIDEPEEDTK